MGREVFLGDLLGKVIERYASGWEEELPLATIRSHWEEIAGPIAKNSYPAKMERGELHIYTEHAAYMQELQLLKTEFIKRIKEKANVSIKKIKIQRKKIERVVPKKNPSQKPGLSESKIANLRRILEKIP